MGNDNIILINIYLRCLSGYSQANEKMDAKIGALHFR